MKKVSERKKELGKCEVCRQVLGVEEQDFITLILRRGRIFFWLDLLNVSFLRPSFTCQESCRLRWLAACIKTRTKPSKANKANDFETWITPATTFLSTWELKRSLFLAHETIPAPSRVETDKGNSSRAPVTYIYVLIYFSHSPGRGRCHVRTSHRRTRQSMSRLFTESWLSSKHVSSSQEFISVVCVQVLHGVAGLLL